MTDKEMLDWIESNMTMLVQLADDTFGMDYIDSQGKHQVVQGVSLRDCIQKANPVKVLEGELHFRHNGTPMKAVPHHIYSCAGCDCYNLSCYEINDSLEASHGIRCKDTHQIMFVHSKDKEEYED